MQIDGDLRGGLPGAIPPHAAHHATDARPDTDRHRPALTGPCGRRSHDVRGSLPLARPFHPFRTCATHHPHPPKTLGKCYQLFLKVRALEHTTRLRLPKCAVPVDEYLKSPYTLTHAGGRAEARRRRENVASPAGSAAAASRVGVGCSQRTPHPARRPWSVSSPSSCTASCSRSAHPLNPPTVPAAPPPPCESDRPLSLLSRRNSGGPSPLVWSPVFRPPAPLPHPDRAGSCRRELGSHTTPLDLGLSPQTVR